MMSFREPKSGAYIPYIWRAIGEVAASWITTPPWIRRLLYVYTLGGVVHSAGMALEGGITAEGEYADKKGSGQITPYKSEFGAFWSGCKGSVWNNIVDTIFWPVKAVAFGIHLFRKRH